MKKPQVVIPRFEVLRRGEVLQTLPINRNRLVVGSEDGAHLRLKHPAIAPRHLEVMVVNGRYLEAANLAGEGRVLLGGQPMNRARLRDGDELDLGPVTLRLTYFSSEAAAEAAIADHEEEEEETVEAGAPVEETTGDNSVDVEQAPAMGKSPTLLDDESDTSSRLSTLGQLLVRPGSTTSESLPALDYSETTESSRLAVDLDEIVLDPAPIVIIEPPGGKAQEVPLRVGSFVVGAGRCAFRLSYPGVAPAHTEIMVMPDGVVYVKHLAGSGLLTIRNGAPIQFARWTAGDRLQVGPVAMRLELVAREVLSSVTHVAKVTSTHSGLTQSAADQPAPRILSAARAAEVEPDPPFSGSTTFSGRALHQTITEDGPAPVVAPLVKVHTSAKQPGKAEKPRKKKRSRASRSHSVEVSLDVSSYETFQSFEEDLEYRPSSTRRYFLHALLLLLAVGVFGQYLYIQQRIGDDVQDLGAGPRTASGDSGLQDSEASARMVGDGPVQVGNRKDARRGSSRKGQGSSRSRDPRDREIDWEDSRGMYFEGARRPSSSATATKPVLARPADELERTEPAAAPTSGGDGQGFVEMKLVNSKISGAHRKFRYCYEQASQDDETLEGTMWLNMTLGLDGRIRGVVVEGRSSLKSDAMRKCLAKKLYSLPMPKPRGGAVTFSAPFKFAPTGQ